MKTFTYARSLATFYLKGEISLDENKVQAQIPNTLLTFIPFGKEKITTPTSQISAVHYSFSFEPKSFVLSLVALFVSSGFFTYDSFLYGLLALLIGIELLIRSFIVLLILEKTSANPVVLDFLIFDKKICKEVSNAIEEVILNRNADTNTRAQTDRTLEASNAQTDRLIDAINKSNS